MKKIMGYMEIIRKSNSDETGNFVCAKVIPRAEKILSRYKSDKNYVEGNGGRGYHDQAKSSMENAERELEALAEASMGYYRYSMVSPTGVAYTGYVTTTQAGEKFASFLEGLYRRSSLPRGKCVLHRLLPGSFGRGIDGVSYLSTPTKVRTIGFPLLLSPEEKDKVIKKALFENKVSDISYNTVRYGAVSSYKGAGVVVWGNKAYLVSAIRCKADPSDYAGGRPTPGYMEVDRLETFSLLIKKSSRGSMKFYHRGSGEKYQEILCDPSGVTIREEVGLTELLNGSVRAASEGEKKSFKRLFEILDEVRKLNF